MKRVLASSFAIGSTLGIWMQISQADCAKHYAEYADKLKTSQILVHHAAFGTGVVGLGIKAAGNPVAGHTVTIASLATMAAMYASIQFPPPMKAEAQEMARMLNLAEVSPTGDDLKLLVGNHPLLQAQTPSSVLRALKRGDLEEKFCSKGRLMNLAEVRESLAQEIVSRSREFPSEQRETTLELIKTLEDRAARIEAQGPRTGSAAD